MKRKIAIIFLCVVAVVALATLLFVLYLPQHHPAEKQIRIHFHGESGVTINGKEFESLSEVFQFFKKCRKRYSYQNQTLVLTGDDDCTIRQIYEVRSMGQACGFSRHAFENNGALMILSRSGFYPRFGGTKQIFITIHENMFTLEEFEGEACKGNIMEDSRGFADKSRYINFINTKMQEGRLTIRETEFDNENEFLNAIENLAIDETVIVYINLNINTKLKSFLKVLSRPSIQKTENIHLWFHD